MISVDVFLYSSRVCVVLILGSIVISLGSHYPRKATRYSVPAHKPTLQPDQALKLKRPTRFEQSRQEVGLFHGVEKPCWFQ